jgi:hypothetical protein
MIATTPSYALHIVAPSRQHAYTWAREHNLPRWGWFEVTRADQTHGLARAAGHYVRAPGPWLDLPFGQYLSRHDALDALARCEWTDLASLTAAEVTRVLVDRYGAVAR